jgi:hypothetical protein
VQDHELTTQIRILARRLEMLDEELRTARDKQAAATLGGPADKGDAPIEALIARLSELVDRLQSRVNERRRGQLGSEPLADLATSHLDRTPNERPQQVASAAAAATRVDVGRARLTPRAGGGHGVHFARSDDHAVAAIIDLFDDARGHGRAAVVVATGSHRRWIEADLHQRCIAFEGDVCRFLDADTTLSSLLVNGQPDRDRFRSVIGSLLADVCSRNPAGVAVYGEMVGILWSRGQAAAALRLEGLWNELLQELPFSLLCGYLVDVNADSVDLNRIRELHTYIG